MARALKIAEREIEKLKAGRIALEKEIVELDREISELAPKASQRCLLRR